MYRAYRSPVAIALVVAGSLLLAASGVAKGEDFVLDCDVHPCAEVVPAAASFRPVPEATYWEALDSGGDVVAWLALSTDFVDIKAYSGKPLITLVGLDPEGVITGARVVHHSEPILLVGIPEKALHDFVDFYAGQPAQQRIVVGRSSQPDTVSVDVISGATVTVLAQNITVLDTARTLGVEVGVFEPHQLNRGHFVSEPEPLTWSQMVETGVLGHLVVSEAQIGMGESSEPAVDLYFGIVDPSHVGRALLGKHEYEYRMKKLEEGEHLFIIYNLGSYSFKGSAFVRGGIFDRVRIQQGLREITFRDTDYWNQPDVRAEGAPEIEEGALFVIRGGRFDPSAVYELVFLSSHYDQRGAFSREFHEFTASHRVPEALYVVEKRDTGLPWRQAWINRPVEIALLVIYLLLVTSVFVARRFTTADPKRLERIHLASMLTGFLMVGVWMGAQPSVTQIFTAVGSVVGEWRWELFLSEPGIFISWIFIFGVSVIWGRGVFCGWVCPYGAMNELAFKISHKLGWKGYELPDAVHLRLRHLRYVILVGLVGIFLYDSILAEKLAEIEPFKSTFLVPAWTRHWGFTLWWLVLIALSFVMYRPFCRYLCPLGGGLSLLSSFRPSGPKRRSFCSHCTICTRGCEPRAIQPNGVIDPRECLSCMECEANYRDEEVCPPLIGIARLEGRSSLNTSQQQKLDTLRNELRDV